MDTKGDPELHTFASGTRPFEGPAPLTLPQALNNLRKALDGRKYRRTRKQKDDAKIVSDRISQDA